MKLEILVKRIESDKGLIIDQNDVKWGMIELCPVKNSKPFWRIETNINQKIVCGTYDDVVINLNSETEIRRYLGDSK